jgi:hypothetical protein
LEVSERSSISGIAIGVELYSISGVFGISLEGKRDINQFTINAKNARNKKIIPSI